MSDPKESGRPEPAQADVRKIIERVQMEMAGQNWTDESLEAIVQAALVGLGERKVAAVKKRADEATELTHWARGDARFWCRPEPQVGTAETWTIAPLSVTCPDCIRKAAEERERQLQARVEELERHLTEARATKDMHKERQEEEIARADKLKALVGQLVEALKENVLWWPQHTPREVKAKAEVALAAAREAGQK